MFTYHRFLVGKDDHFDADRFPQIDAELSSLGVEIAKFPSVNRIEMLLSFLKGNPIKNEFLVSNPTLAEMLSENSLPTRSIEALFKSCTNNSLFCGQLEDYVRSGLTSIVMLPLIIFRTRYKD